MANSSSQPRWSGDRLNRPEMVQAFTDQLRRHLSEYVDHVAHIRRDAEAMWAENPPEGYSSFEAWWRHGRVTAPFAEIEEHLAKAVKLTFRLEARYRKHRHEIPAKRQAAALAKQEAAQLPRGTDAASPPAPPRQAGPSVRQPASAPPLDSNFMETIRRNQRPA